MDEDSPAADPSGFPDWEMTPVAPPGLEDYMPTFLGWVFWICFPIAIIAFVASGVMMAVGRFGGRGAVSADGMRQFVWACLGTAVITMAISIVTGIFRI